MTRLDRWIVPVAFILLCVALVFVSATRPPSRPTGGHELVVTLANGQRITCIDSAHGLSCDWAQFTSDPDYKKAEVLP